MIFIVTIHNVEKNDDDHLTESFATTNILNYLGSSVLGSRNTGIPVYVHNKLLQNTRPDQNEII